MSWKTGYPSKMLTVCPICRNDFSAKPEEAEFESIQEALAFILKWQGEDICYDEVKICGLIADLLPERIDDRILLNSFLKKGIGLRFADWKDNNTPIHEINQFLHNMEVKDSRSWNLILHLLERHRDEGENMESDEPYIRYAESGVPLNYKIKALEKALQFNTSPENAERLAETEATFGSGSKGREKLIELSESGNTDAMLALSRIFEQGIGISKDYIIAFKYLENAMERGAKKADFLIGRFYRLGFGVKGDDEKAKEYFLKAAGHGNVEAAYQLYCILSEKDGVTDQALTYLKMAEKGGIEEAKYETALNYLYGNGVKKSVLKAIQLLEECSDAGSLDAIYKLIFIYDLGYDVPKNPNKVRNLQNRVKALEQQV